MNISLPIVCVIVMMMTMRSCEGILAKGPKEVEAWVENLRAHSQYPKSEKVTKLHFYFHRTATSGVVVAQPSDRLPMGFGVVVVKDDPLTLGADLSSSVHVGYAQGIAPIASLEDTSIYETYALVFTHYPGVHNGTTLAVAGTNPLLQQYREVAIVGGTGDFRLARGIATYQTTFFNTTTNTATVEVDIVVFHY